MKTTQLTFAKLRLPFRKPFVTARGTLHERETFMVALRDSEGRIGIGEAAPLPAFGGESMNDAEGMLSFLARQSSFPDCEASLEGIANWREQVGLATQRHPVTSFGIESALLSLASQANNVHPAKLLGLPAGLHDIKTHALITGDSVSDVEAAAACEIERGFTMLKIKVGVRNAQDDIELLRRLHERFPHVAWRADANGHWDVVSATYFLNETENCRLDYVEDPVSVGHISDLGCLPSSLRERIGFDEAASQAANPAEFLSAHEPAVIILKPPLLGSFRRIQEWRAAARTLKTRLIVTSFLESSIGLHYDALCALMVDLRHEVHGLATADLLAQDSIEYPLTLIGGKLTSRDPRGLSDALTDSLKITLSIT